MTDSAEGNDDIPNPTDEVRNLVPRSMCADNCILPLYVQYNVLYVALPLQQLEGEDPAQAFEDLRNFGGFKNVVSGGYFPREDIQRAINRNYGSPLDQATTEEILEEIIMEVQDEMKSVSSEERKGMERTITRRLMRMVGGFGSIVKQALSYVFGSSPLASSDVQKLPLTPTQKVIECIPETMARIYNIVPLTRTAKQMQFAIASDTSASTKALVMLEVSGFLSLDVVLVPAYTQAEISQAIERIYGPAEGDDVITGF